MPEQDDIAVERLKAAGAIVIGKTNAAEFGYGAFGHNPLFPTTRNPWDPALTPGGSSAGSAAAVAAGVCPLAVGSDGGGSVRLPAAFTGLVGIKASMGRVPVWPGCRDPALPGASGWESIEHIGPLARSVADAALMLAVMAGPDARDRWSLPADGVDWRDAARRRSNGSALKDRLLPAVGGRAGRRRTCGRSGDAAGGNFETLGCRGRDARRAGAAAWWRARRAIIALETDISGMRKLAAGRELAPVAARCAACCNDEWHWRAIHRRAHRAQALRSRRCARFMERYDLMLTPTAPLLPFAIDREGPGTIDGQPVEDDCWMPAMFPVQSHRPARRQRAGGLDRRTGCRPACRSSAGISPMRRC